MEISFDLFEMCIKNRDSMENKKMSSKKGKNGLTIVIVIFLIALTVFNLYNLNKVRQADKIIKENIVLKDKLAQLHSKLDTLMIKVKAMENWEDTIREKKNLKHIKKDLRKMGTGGLPVTDSTFYGYDLKLSTKYNGLLSKIQNIENKVNFDYETHKKVYDYYLLKKELSRYTPSIYPTFGRISDYYGWRVHPFTKKKTFHHGIDIANNKGTPVYATADGIIKKANRQRLFGKFVRITHKFGYETGYGHLSKVFVKKGQKVKRGQIIGLMGSTGRSTGSHLHYEILRYHKFRNPASYLNRKKIAL